MEINIPLPLNLVFRFVEKPINKRLKKIFEQSQLVYERRKEQIYSVKLNNFIEYSLKFENKFSIKTIYQTHSQPSSRIYIKNNTNHGILT